MYAKYTYSTHCYELVHHHERWRQKRRHRADVTRLLLLSRPIRSGWGTPAARRVFLGPPVHSQPHRARDARRRLREQTEPAERYQADPSDGEMAERRRACVEEVWDGEC